MAITKRPVASKGAEEFIGGAPDAGAVTTADKPRKKIMQGTKEQVSVTFPAGKVDAIVRAGNRLGLSRAGVINLAVSKLLEELGES